MVKIKEGNILLINNKTYRVESIGKTRSYLKEWEYSILKPETGSFSAGSGGFCQDNCGYMVVETKELQNRLLVTRCVNKRLDVYVIGHNGLKPCSATLFNILNLTEIAPELAKTLAANIIKYIDKQENPNVTKETAKKSNNKQTPTKTVRTNFKNKK